MDDQCVGCNYKNPVGGLTERRDAIGDTVLMCQICSNTFAGREVCGRATDDGRILRTVAWIGNRLRDDLRQAAAK